MGECGRESLRKHLLHLHPCVRAVIERAAELLREGKHNVTEAAFEVGYSSLSHFTVAFREVFGCCPGLYPVAASGLEPAVGSRRGQAVLGGARKSKKAGREPDPSADQQ